MSEIWLAILLATPQPQDLPKRSVICPPYRVPTGHRHPPLRLVPGIDKLGSHKARTALTS